MQNQEPVKNHMGALTLIMLVLRRTIIPLKDPELSVGAAELHGDILQSFLVRAKCEKQQYITLR